MFDIITRRTINEYILKYPTAKIALINWYYKILDLDFKNFNELKCVYTNASLMADERVIFNIKGNIYRLATSFSFKFKLNQTKWFGTHKGYDKINAETASHRKS